MPGGNGTGPTGMGSMTGRGAGRCTGNSVAGAVNPMLGKNFGFGNGRKFGFGGGNGFISGGRGRRNMFSGRNMSQSDTENPMYNNTQYNQTMSKKQELDMLKDQSSYFKNSMDEIKKRIEELEIKE